MPRLFYTDNKLQEVNQISDFPSRDLRACSIGRSFARSGFSSAQKPLPAGYLSTKDRFCSNHFELCNIMRVECKQHILSTTLRRYR
jgi:hypothetical protein